MLHLRRLIGLSVMALALASRLNPAMAQAGSNPIGEKPTPSFPAEAAEASERAMPSTGTTTVRQEPAVSLEWVGPTQVQFGRPADYTLSVRNISNVGAQQVLLRVQMPAGTRVLETEPKANTENDVLWWELGTLAAKQQKNLSLRMVSDTRGDLTCHAWVTLTGCALMKVKVHEPRLAVKITAPEKAGLGDAVAFAFVVSNPGDGTAEAVKIHATLSDGLEHPAGKQIDFDVGNLPPKESRTVRLVCVARSGGEQKCETVIEGMGDLRVRDRAALTVTTPRLDVEVSGPKLRYLDRKAVYVLKVSNAGNGVASNVSLSDVIPAGFKFHTASDGGVADPMTRTVAWALGEIPPGQGKEVKLEVVAVAPGEHHHQVTAQAARGLKVEHEVVTRVEGVSSLALEVLESDNPIEVGAEVCYEVRVKNNGTKTESDIKLVVAIPDQMEFKNGTGPARCKHHEKEAIFEALPKLEPGADVIYRVTLIAKTAGDARFKAMVTSSNMPEPMLEMQSTRIYQD